MFSLRKLGAQKRLALAMVLAMCLPGVGPTFRPTVHAQAAPVGAGFVLDAGDLRFIFHAIEIAQDHAAGGTLLGPGPNQVNLFGTPNPQLPLGLRTVDGSFNNLVTEPDQHLFGASDLVFPRLTTPNFRPAEQGTSYTQKSGNVFDSQPRTISNLIVDQTANNPAAAAAAANPCGSGGFVCQGPQTTDPNTGTFFIPNITPDFGLSAPFNLMFTFFGQFFDHGLDLVNKGGSGFVIMPLQPDDPLFVPGSQTNFMVLTRATNQPGPDGILGTADDVQDGINQTTPWVDQNQTYTSHPSHQVFLRQYAMVNVAPAGQPAQLRPFPDGNMLDGGFCAPRTNGVPGEQICNIGDWAEVKAQAATKLGIHLLDQDVFDVPLLLTDPYGHFKPGPNGFPQLVLPGNVLLEGNPAANAGAGISIPANAFRTGHQFLNDIAHNAAPNPGLVADSNTTISVFGVDAQDPGTYDDELLDRHLVTGDGRGNENIALSAMHTIFHAEHNRLRNDIDRLINTPGFLTPAEVAGWHSVHAGSGWGYGERLFQAARFVTEMEYQHLVFEEFARKMQPRINPFLGGITDINPAIKAEFAHTVYRLGHSMLPEVIARINADGTANDIRLRDAFLNPVAFNETGTGVQSAPHAVGSLVRGLSRQVGNELDEFVVDAVRNSLVGLPLDLAAINLARGRSEGIPSLNSARRQFFNATNDSSVAPYPNWFEFGLNLKHAESLVNFVAAYGTDPSITGATTIAAKRNAAKQLVAANGPFMFAPAATSGLDNVDFWIGGLAERQAVFGGLLGSTFNFVFEKQLEDLQNGDRFYYLQRLDGLNLRDQLESNSLAELARRNSDVGGTMDNVFETADFNLDVASFTGTAPVDLGNGASLLTLADGTKFFSDPQHRGFNIMFNGTSGDDRMRGDVGDDTFYGNAGNDRIEGGEGNDTLVGGDGDDVLFGGPGDDVLKGGTGNDALASGPGFGGDILLGGDGNDFLLGGDDGVEHFGGPGDDVVVDGAQRAEAIFGGPGDDWIYAGDGHDGGIFGDDGNVFDLLAGLSKIGGDDVLDGGPGQDNHFGEGGDDIFLMNEGTNKYFGDFGFDWITQRGWPVPADIELDLLALPATPINFNDLRNKYRMVDGASGWDLDDHIRGDSRTNDPAAPIELFNLPGTELTAGTPPVAEPAVGPAAAFGQRNFRGGSGAAKIAGLTDLVINGFGKTFPFNAGNILLGGGGRDLIEGKGGDDLIDGDSWLNVQLRAVLNDGTVKLVDSPVDLVDDVFADPQRLNPGNISIIRSIVLGAPAVDTAVFTGPRADYKVTLNPNGTVTVAHTAGAGFGTGNDGTDTLRNIELLQFSDRTIVAPGADVRIVPDVVGMTQAAATAAITGAGLTVGAVTTAFSDTIPAGRVISSTPAAGSVELPGAPVALVVSRGSNDVTPPTVSIASPAAGATVSGTVDVTATAADNVGVVGVQFLLDGNLLGAEDTTAPYSVAWNTTAAANGTHTLAARARDASGNVATSAAVTVTVFNDLTPPTVSLTAPANAATVSGTITVSATAADNIGVAGVQFLLDNVALGAEDTAAPYSVAWNTTAAANGTHTLAARARDASGNVATSAAVTVTVFNDLTPPTVSLTAPANAATVSGTITVSATAADNVGVAGVQFLLDNVALGAEDTAVPYSVAWDTTTAANRTHTLAARARDASGNVATSPAVTVTVNNAPTMELNVSNTQLLSLANTSPSITPAANTLIVAFVSAGPQVLGLGGLVGGNAAVNSVTNTGSALTWTRAAWSNNQSGTAEIWWAFTTPAHAAMTVTATLSDAMSNSMRVVTFSGASPLTGAATAIASAASGAHLVPAATLTTTRASSLVFMVGTDTQAARTMVAPAGQTIVGQFNPLANTFWVQRTTAGVPTAGTAVTMTSTYASATFPDPWNVALIEIRTS